MLNTWPPYRESNCLLVLVAEGFCIGYNASEIATAAGPGHLPGKDLVLVFIYIALDASLYHLGEHSGLGVEAGFVGLSECLKVFVHYRLPAVVCGLGQGLDLRLGDVFAFYHRAAGASGFHRNHHQMLLQPAEDGFIIAGLNLLGPEAVVVVVAAEAGDADANGVLRSGDDAVGALGVVLKAEHQFGQHLRVHIGQLVGPDLANLVAGAGAQAATLTYLKGGLQRDGDGPTGGVLRDVGLVNPGAGKVKTGRYLAFCLLEVGGGAGFESLLGYAPVPHILFHALHRTGVCLRCRHRY